MKKGLVKLLSVILCGLMLFTGFTACGGKNPGSGEIEKEDASKTQLYVYNFNGGYGSEWLKNVKRRFEAAYDDTEFEPGTGKRGVQVIIDNTKSGNVTIEETIGSSHDEVFFLELASMQSLIRKGLLLDITDAITEPLTEFGETKSIEDKMYDQQKTWYGKDGKYYGVPHYAAFWGIIYNVDLFDKNMLYYSDRPAINDGFIISDTDKRSAGPDGEYDTYDDGLPATYEDFYKLCARMVNMGIVPFTWTGKYLEYVDGTICSNLWADHEGAEQISLIYNMNGTATDIVTSFTQEGVPVTESVNIGNANAYRLYQQAGAYYALSFLEKIISEGWYTSGSFINTQSHLLAQADFLYSDIIPGRDKIAFLADGCWWLEEANSVFEEMTQLYGESASRQNRNFAWLPLPKATSADIGKKGAIVDTNWSACFVNANVSAEKKDLTKLFVRFCNTDESLAEFSISTNTTKALRYTLTEDQYDRLTTYGKSIYETQTRRDLTFSYSTNPLFTNNTSAFFWGDQWQSIVNGESYNRVTRAIKNYGVTARQFFDGMKNYYTASRWQSSYADYIN